MSDLDQRADRYRALVTEEIRQVVGDRPEGLFAWMRYHLGWEDADGNPVDASPGKMIRWMWQSGSGLGTAESSASV